jgi:type VI secretion system protein ImpE
MTQAEALFKAGQLGAAIAELTREVKARPADERARTFLFELLCFAGEWERAEKQLEVIGHQQAQAEAGTLVYRNNIEAERARQRFRAGGGEPHFLSEPPAYVDLLIDAARCLHEGRFGDARALFDRVEEERPALSGEINGRRFGDFRDFDDATAPVLELFVKDKYTWLPFEQVLRIEVEAPARLRDLLWAPTRIESTDGVLGEVFLPVLYAGTNLDADEMVRLGRVTDRRPAAEGVHLAVGAHLFVTDGDDEELLGVRSLVFDAAQAEPPPGRIHNEE